MKSKFVCHPKQSSHPSSHHFAPSEMANYWLCGIVPGPKILGIPSLIATGGHPVSQRFDYPYHWLSLHSCKCY